MIALYDANHPTVASCERQLGYVLIDLDRPGEAITNFRSALAIDRKAHGNASYEVAEDLNGLGEALLASRDVPEAERAFKELEADLEAGARAPTGSPGTSTRRRGASARRSSTSSAPRAWIPRIRTPRIPTPTIAPARPWRSRRRRRAAPRIRGSACARRRLSSSRASKSWTPCRRGASAPRGPTRPAAAPAAARLVRLYEIWRGRGLEWGGSPAGLDAEIERWKKELERRRELDAGARESGIEHQR